MININHKANKSVYANDINEIITCEPQTWHINELLLHLRVYSYKQISVPSFKPETETLK